MLPAENSKCKFRVESAGRREMEATEKFRNSLAIMLIAVVYYSRYEKPDILPLPPFLSLPVYIITSK